MVVIVNLTPGMITPSVGGLLFVTAVSKRVSKRVSITELTREMPLFLLAHFVVLCLLTFIPELSTWLPHTLASSKADCAGSPGLRASRGPFFSIK